MNQGDRLNRRRRLLQPIWNGYRFHFVKETETKVYLRCAGWPRCTVMAHVEDGVFTLSPRTPRHNHPPIPQLQVVDEFLERLHLRTTHQWTSLQCTYDAVISEFPGLQNNVTFFSVAQRMYRWRCGLIPPEIHDYADMQRELQSPTWQSLRTHDRGIMQMNALTAADGVTAAVWGDMMFVENLQNVTSLHIGVNTLTKPNIDGTIGVFSVSILHSGRAFTVGFGLLNELSVDICTDLMTWCRTELLPRINPQKVFTNLDWRLRRAIESVWGNEITIITPFHQVGLALLHEAESIADLNLQDNDHLKILRKLLVLLWLPGELIQEMFQWLSQSIEMEGLGGIFQPLLVWFHEKLLRGIGPHRISLYEDFDLFSEVSLAVAWNIRNRAPGGPNLDVWAFFRTTLRITANSYDDMDRIRQGPPHALHITRTPRVRSCIQRPALRQLWGNLQRNEISPIRFLTVAANVVAPFLNLLIYQREFVDYVFEPIQPQEQVENNLHEGDFIGPLPRHDLLLAEMNVDNLLGLVARRPRRVIGAENNIDGQGIAEEPQQAADEEEPEEEEPNFENYYDWQCVRCREQKIMVVSRPCNCVAICQDCEREVREEGMNGMLQCPNCHERVITFERVYILETQNVLAPYDWECQICHNRPVDTMARQCRQLMLCHTCADRINEEDRRNRRALRCPLCNGPGNMERDRWYNDQQLRIPSNISNQLQINFGKQLLIRLISNAKYLAVGNTKSQQRWEFSLRLKWYGNVNKAQGNVQRGFISKCI